ncbi:carboxylesterase family protein [Phenylobacterium sp. SCN 70-31]|uniref:carboxylesterase/lipase family protein n=1 Tax=Phenylobacterium sp. SCN 70-31 TaxID=1660129 RepID=UPI00086AF4F4|nr:carboxylesterase family protein [Phenylobacterium sp. SCN 70-31]ODT84752.1 MAG: hypothetical protein ABS78_22150 [Phenylobacterium sp. SCN 70-31]
MPLPTSLSRRAALGGLAFGGLSSVGLPFGGPASGRAAAAADLGAPVVATRHGQVRGRRAGAATVFQGIPYGADTASRRFMPSGPPPAWDGVRDAGAFGPIAPQMRPGRPSIYSSWANPQPESEDCLNLNVYTPGLDASGRRPVMVWFHGGGFVSGSSALRYADGARLAAKGEVVVVTVNHRLGALGYLFVPELGAAYADSGNAGTSDMILALEWVRDNISGFGGDPANVTIFGQSGGGAKVSTLMAAPRARGLFHKAIVQSSSNIRGTTPAEARGLTERVLAAVDGGGGRPDVRTLPFGDLSAAADRAGVLFNPVVDGRTLPRHPFEPDAPPGSEDVPLLIGTTKDETVGLIGGFDTSLFDLTWATLPSHLGPLLPGADVAKIVADLRRRAPDATAADAFFRATTEGQYRRRAIAQAERKVAQGGAPVFMYLFAWETPVDGGRWKSSHSIEHGFVFDNLDVSASMVGADPPQALADAVSSAWVRFARTGSPGWPAFDPATRETMIFDTVSKVVSDPGRADRLLFAGLSPE